MRPFKEWANESPSTQEEPALSGIDRFVFVKAERLLPGIQALIFIYGLGTGHNVSTMCEQNFTMFPKKAHYVSQKTFRSFSENI